jgi:hypothetical protein
MTGLLAAITPRDVPARVWATCSDVSFVARIAYEAPRPDGRSLLQRRIEAALQAPAQGWMVSAGGVEFWFDDGVRLSAINLYAAFAAAPEAELAPMPEAPPAWLALPGFDTAADDRFSVAAAVRVSIDRRRRAVRLALSSAGDVAATFALAEGLAVRVDGQHRLVDLTAHDVVWESSAPVA